MATGLKVGLVPRNGHTLQVIITGRVSDVSPGKQDVRSLDDQEAMHRDWLKQNAETPSEVRVVAGSGSGELLERKEFLELIELVESGRYDLVLTEDLGRIVRRIHAHLFCELCVDNGVRLIAFNDHVDTAEDGWQDRSIFSAWHHERSNRDTSDRIKRTQRNRFVNGGCAALPIFGYRKNPGAKSDADWEKIPEAEPIYQEWFRRLDNGSSYSEIADWLNANGVETGPYCENEMWDGPMVGRICHNILLKGYRYRNKRKTKRDSKGKYRSEDADAADLLIRPVPHLAFFDEAYYDRVIAKADVRNAKCGRDTVNGIDPCARPRKRSRFPGQTLKCSCCGYEYVWGGHGQTDHLECGGARVYRCWQGTTVDGPLAAERICTAALAEVERLADFDAAFLGKIDEEAGRCDEQRNRVLNSLQRSLAGIDSELGNLAAFIRRGDDSEWLREDLRRLEAERRKILGDIDEQQRLPRNRIVIPSIDEIKALARQAVGPLALDSFEFAKVMRDLTKPVVVAPYRCCDGGDVVLRGHFQLQLAALLPDKRLQEVLGPHLLRELTVDLFRPPQRVEFREQVMALRKQHTERVVAKMLGLTITAAQRAAALQRLMDSQGLIDPYVRVFDPPEDLTKLRRHKHVRYRFEPRQGHTPG